VGQIEDEREGGGREGRGGGGREGGEGGKDVMTD
jgi:hypothetical protein